MLNLELNHYELLLMRNALFYLSDLLCGELEYDPQDNDCTNCVYTTLCVEVHKCIAQVQDKVNRNK